MKKRVIALGFFDGVHIGHAALFEKVGEEAARLDMISTALSFDTHPDALVTGRAPLLINTKEDREYTIKTLYGMDEAFFAPFDRQMMEMPWDSFITDYLVGKLNAGGVVAGHDFRFGYRGEGNADKLKSKCAEKGLVCDIVPKVTKNGITVSSTYIRELISRGDMETAIEFLGHPYFFGGYSAKGRGIGSKKLVATANLPLPEGMLPPARGVYASKVEVDGVEHTAVTNVGVNPTVGALDRITVESHLLNFSEELYGRYLRVYLYRHIRPEMKFSSVEALKEQILRDAKTAEDYFK